MSYFPMIFLLLVMDMSIVEIGEAGIWKILTEYKSYIHSEKAEKSYSPKYHFMECLKGAYSIPTNYLSNSVNSNIPHYSSWFQHERASLHF